MQNNILLVLCERERDAGETEFLALKPALAKRSREIDQRAQRRQVVQHARCRRLAHAALHHDTEGTVPSKGHVRIARPLQDIPHITRITHPPLGHQLHGAHIGVE